MATRQPVVNLVAALAVVSPMIAFVAMRSVDGWDPAIMTPAGHFYVVSAAAMASATIGVSLLVGVSSLRQTRTVFLALGFVAIALIFATHGLGTPGFIVPAGPRYLAPVSISPALSSMAGALFVAVSALPTRALPRRLDGWSLWMVAGTVALLAGYVVVSLARPQTWDWLAGRDSWQSWLAAATLMLLAFSAWRYWQAWQLTRFPGQAAMVVALALLGQAQLSMHYGQPWHLSWWLYHVLLLAAFVVLLGGWGMEARRAKSLVLFSRALALRDQLDRVQLTRPESLAALEEAMDYKDTHTREHMGRVAAYAAAIARELGCDDDTVALAETAGRIHDIGKIAVPDAVLFKPGALTEREFAQMKGHTERGAHIARKSEALAPVADIVRAHHERWDGRGYPDGRRGDDIPLAARIVAVADTFDALTSPRAYRAARTVDQAVAELHRVAGSQLDPVCVAAFLAWLEREGRQAVFERAA
ncbi:MAG: hypothetical protein Kow0010_00540 [Dehalococcoidia bacterium]